MTRRRTARLVAAVALLSLAPGAVRAQPQPSAPGPSTPAASGVSAQPGDRGGDAWHFDDDDQVKEPPLTEVLRPQLVDIVAFPIVVVLALVGFFRKSERLKVITLVVTLIYLGFIRSQMYSVVNIFGLMSMNLPIFKHSIFMYLFWAVTLGTTILWGRLYCGRLCAFGALTQLMDKVVPAKWRVTVPPKLEQNAFYVKYALLAFVIAYYMATHDILIYRYVEPFWMFTRQGSVVMWTGLAALLLATIFVRNLYCRFICPVGTFLGVISSVTTIFRIKRWAECKTCKICERTCEWGAIQGPRIVRSECVRCDDCERLYMDQQKCVHWIVIRKKSEVLARQAAAIKA
jgi:polyferredoxin